MKKTMKMPDTEPEQTTKFQLVSEGEHTFQVVDIIDNADPSIVLVKLEVSEGDEIGRSILHRVSLDENWKGFFTTRLFLKAIGEPYKGDTSIDTDMWIGKTFVASVVHNQNKDKTKTFANIDQYNFDVTPSVNPGGAKTPADVSWEE